MRPRKLLIVNVAALGTQSAPPGFNWRTAETIFPAVTCSVQASFRTASAPGAHGMVSNGLYFSDLKKVLFWEQAASLVEGERIWKQFRERGNRVGLMFWQQSLGESVDLVLSPAPIHKHSGGMIQDCFAKPDGLYERLIEKTGRPFNLMNYWGPLASRKSSDWIADATCAVMEMDDAPELLMTYIPHLDYDLQRFGPGSHQAQAASRVLAEILTQLRNQAERHGYEFLIFGDYAMEPVTSGAVFPNRALREAGLFSSRCIRGMHYADFYTSRAFAMVDHQFAHLFAPDATAAAAAKSLFETMPGVAAVLDREAQAKQQLHHRRSGDLMLIAEPGAWFAYPWWNEEESAPDYATHVDIHNKPGYDPCELFFGWPPLSVSRDTTKIRGTHGRPGAQIAWTSSAGFNPDQSGNLIELAESVRQWLNA
jgi:predicted AlkP superfamily pyrophosphatase or phosphodiesterase